MGLFERSGFTNAPTPSHSNDPCKVAAMNGGVGIRVRLCTVCKAEATTPPHQPTLHPTLHPTPLPPSPSLTPPPQPTRPTTPPPPPPNDINCQKTFWLQVACPCSTLGGQI